MQAFAYRIKNYGIKVAFGDPNIQTVKNEAMEGRFSFVVVSNNLIDQPNNMLFLQAIGQGHLLNQDEKEVQREEKLKFMNASHEKDREFKLNRATSATALNKR